MDNKYYEDYLKITRGYTPPAYQYTSPEEQGLAIKKCTILEATDLCYSTGTTVDYTNKEQGNGSVPNSV